MFWQDGQPFRQINLSGKTSYDLLMSSRLYEDLVERKLLISHRELTASETPKGVYKILAPEMVPFISYPYEWSFSQLKDSAIATLDIQEAALGKGMTLRDASAYNIQLVGGKPQLIDTLSFEAYERDTPWQAYRQFCQHFLAPLALMSYSDIALGQLSQLYIDGIPPALAAKLLPLRARLRPGLALHLTAHARLQRQHQSDPSRQTRPMNMTALLGLLDNLKRTILALKSPAAETEWGDYYEHTNYTKSAMAAKHLLVAQYIEQIKPKRVLDLGANDGSFSRIAAASGALTISADIDPIAVEHGYLHTKKVGEKLLLPLRIDLTNPSPALGWNNIERASFSNRAHADIAMALALVHHLAISNNLPLSMVAAYCSELAPYLIIEFVPKQDSQVKRLLATREDIFPEYTKTGFEKAFGEYFDISEQKPVTGTERTMYLMKRRKCSP